MEYLIPYISKDLILYSISSLSSSISATQNIFNFIIDHKDSDYEIYQKQLSRIDLINKLQIVSSLIQDIVTKHNIEKDNIEKDNKEKYNDEKDNIENNTDYIIVNMLSNNKMNLNIAKPIKISLISTLDIINKINITLEIIQTKIVSHQNSYLRIIKKINLHDEVADIIHYNMILDNRLSIFFNVLKIYNCV
jgi:hypothetical protein